MTANLSSDSAACAAALWRKLQKSKRRRASQLWAKSEKAARQARADALARSPYATFTTPRHATTPVRPLGWSPDILARYHAAVASWVALNGASC
jgi:hypothetical protein